MTNIGCHCHHCGVHTLAEVVADEFYYTDEADLDGRYRLVKCSNCKDLTLLYNIVLPYLEGDPEDPVAVFPVSPSRYSQSVPEGLSKCLDEANVCLRNRAFTASTLMFRRALELLAADRGVDKGTLANRLQELRTRGDIDERLLKWADALRLSGNRAAHDVDPDLTVTDANDVSDLTQAIVDYVYVYQERYLEFMERHERRRQADPEPESIQAMPDEG